MKNTTDGKNNENLPLVTPSENTASPKQETYGSIKSMESNTPTHSHTADDRQETTPLPAPQAQPAHTTSEQDSVTQALPAADNAAQAKALPPQRYSPYPQAVNGTDAATQTADAQTPTTAAQTTAATVQTTNGASAPQQRQYQNSYPSYPGQYPYSPQTQGGMPAVPSQHSYAPNPAYNPYNQSYPSSYSRTNTAYSHPYQSAQQPQKKWTNSALILASIIALILGGLTGGFIASHMTNSEELSPYPYGYDNDSREDREAFPDYGNGVFGEDGSDPYFPDTSRHGSSGSRVESAPGVLLIDSLLTGGIGSGSGMIISEDGYAVTNYHVVEGSTTVRVTVADTEKTYTASVVGHDASSDVALLKLEDAADLEYVEFDTSQVSRGDEVSIIGNAGGQGYLSKLEGKITALNQDITAMSEGEGSEDLTGLIETDADVVQGYSGGPMYNNKGKVIGVIVAASSAGRSGDTDGYAIPADIVTKIVEQIKTGKSQGSTIVGPNAALGVTVASEGLENDTNANIRGAHIIQIAKDSAAQEAGIKAGDVITGVNGTSVKSASDLSKLVKTFAIGDKVKITYVDSSGEEKTIDVNLGESPVN